MRGSNRPKLGTTPKDVVWRRDKAQLWRYRGGPSRYAQPLLIVTSLVSRSYILDLLPGSVDLLSAELHLVIRIDDFRGDHVANRFSLKCGLAILTGPFADERVVAKAKVAQLPDQHRIEIRAVAEAAQE